MYDTDFFRWTEATATALRDGRLSEVDLEHAAEEIEDMGKRERRKLESRAVVLIQHLLKRSIQPERRATSTWLATIHEQRRKLARGFKKSPSLSSLVQTDLQELYIDAAEAARDEMGLDVPLPAECPFTASQILDRDWLPD